MREREMGAHVITRQLLHVAALDLGGTLSGGGAPEPHPELGNRERLRQFEHRLKCAEGVAIAGLRHP